MMRGAVKRPVYMVQAINTDTGCIFFHDGLCELHDKGLKPTEGRLSHHSMTLENFTFRKSLSWNIAKEWLDINNADQVLRIFNKISKDNA